MDSSSILNPVSIINLNLSFKSLSSLEDIRKYKNLIEIDLTGNVFKNLSELSSVLMGFSYLKKLNLAFNSLAECPELPQQIESLILNNNVFKNIDSNLLRMKNLVTLDLSNNSIQDISRLVQLSKIKILFLKNNKISQISNLVKLELLQELDLEGNPVDDREQVIQFKDHQFLRVLNLRNTPISSTSNESYSNRRQLPSPLPNLPFVREGALCRNAKTLKASYIYAAFTDTCNPNRSALINKSLINQRKYSSDSEFTDEYEEEDDIPHEIPGSILGSVRSNYLESAGLLTSENSTRHERKLSNQGVHQRQTSGLEAKLTSNTAKEVGKLSTAHNSNRNVPDKSYSSKISIKSGSNSLINGKKPAIKLDLSSILKDKIAQPGNASLQNGMQFTGSYIHTANTSLFNSLNSSQIKISPIVADSITEKAAPAEYSTVPHKVLKFNLVTPEPNFSASLRRNSKNSEIVSPNIINTADKGNTLQSYVNSLLEENNGLKKEVMILRQTNHDLEKQRANEKIKSTKTSPARRMESPRLREENARLLAKLSSLEKKYETIKQELKAEKTKTQDTHKDLIRVATIYLKHEISPQMDSSQLINQLERSLKTSQNSTKQGVKKRDTSPPSEQTYELQKNTQERLKMTINDLESQIAFKYQEKVAALQRLIKGYQKNLDLVMKKYESLKQSTREKSVAEVHSNSQKKIPLPRPNADYSSDNITYNQNSSLNLTNFGEDTHISDGKDEQLNQLKSELVRVKQSLESMMKKYNALLIETEDLKADSNKAANSLQIKMRDLEAENRKFMSTVNKGETLQSPKAKAVYRCVNLFDGKLTLNRSLEFCLKGSNLNNTSLIADKNTSQHINTKAVNRTSLNLTNTLQARESLKTSPSSKLQGQSTKKMLTEADLSLQKDKDSKKGTYTKKLSKILDPNSAKQNHKIQNYV